jgi:RNA-binding protein with serine-rich domain 1
VTAGHLEEIFGLYGKVKKVDLAKDRALGLSKGYAYVEYEEREKAEQAQLYLDGVSLP